MITQQNIFKKLKLQEAKQSLWILIPDHVLRAEKLQISVSEWNIVAQYSEGVYVQGVGPKEKATHVTLSNSALL